MLFSSSQNGVLIRRPLTAPQSGWELSDEIDMQQGPGRGYTTLNNILTLLPNDRRMRYNNYGKGVMFWETDEQATRFVNDFQQVVSNDIYWFTDPNVSRSSEGGKLLNDGRPLKSTQTRRAANYGYTIDRIAPLDAHKPIWNFVEVGWPFTETAAQGARAIQPAEVKAAVWHSIIAGARGIIYFNHSFGGRTRHNTAYATRDMRRCAPPLKAPINCSRNLRQYSMHHSRMASSAPIRPSGQWRSSMKQRPLCICWQQRECRQHRHVFVVGRRQRHGYGHWREQNYSNLKWSVLGQFCRWQCNSYLQD